MRETLEIGSSPCDEDCAQVGQEDYRTRARLECDAFREQLRRQFGPEPEGARLMVKAISHDFGTYFEVAVQFDDENEAAARYAYQVEGNTPARWDGAARIQLGLELEN